MFIKRYKYLRYGREQPGLPVVLSRKLVGGVAKDREINWVGIIVINMGVLCIIFEYQRTNRPFFVQISQ